MKNGERTQAALAVLVVAIAAVSAWVVVTDSRDPSLSRPTLGSTEAEEAVRDSALPEDSLDETASTQRVELPEAPLSQPTVAPDRGGTARLEVLVISKESRERLSDAALEVLVSDPDATAGTAEWIDSRAGARSPRSDFAGQASFRVPAGHGIVVRAFRNGTVTSKEVGPLATGQVDDVFLEVSTTELVRFVGRVVEQASGRPVPEARVRFPGGPARPGAATPGGRAQECGTDARGWFELMLPVGVGQDAQVDAPGFGPKLFRPDATHLDRQHALRVELQRGATLRGRVRGLPVSGDEYVVRVEANGYEFSVGAGAGGIDSLRRDAPVRADGTWEVADLPPGAGLHLELQLGEESVFEEPARLFLEPGEERLVEWALDEGSTLRGRAVVADSGEPLPRYPIWLLPAKEARGVLHPGRSPATVVSTDDAGYFVFPGLPPGEWAVGPAPERATGDEIFPRATQVTIPSAPQLVEVELRLYRGLFIRGRILGPDAETPEVARVRAFNEELRVSATGSSGEDGMFRIGPLVPGPYRVNAWGGAADRAPSERVTAAAGDEDVVLILRPGGSIHGRVLDAASGESLSGLVQVAREDGKGGYSMRTRSDGSFSFTGLSYGSYVVSASRGDLAGMVGAVRIGPGRTERNAEVLLEPGASLRILYTGRHPFAELSVEAEETRMRWSGGRYERGQAWRLVLTPGHVVVTASPEASDGTSYEVQRTVELVAGEETIVEVGDE